MEYMDCDDSKSLTPDLGLLHHKHNQHPLTLLPRRHCVCNVCGCEWKFFTYTCDNCNFHVCMFCAFLQRVLLHEGHHEHALTSMQREALFKCDACAEEAKDSSYACTTCEFWIHKKCAFSPFIIPSPTYHHHPLNFVYSIPDNHRYFERFCGICKKLVQVIHWLYYCHKCTYFVHISCATSTVATANTIEEDDTDRELDLVQFPLDGEESLLDLIMVQCAKLQVNFEGDGKNSITTSTMPNGPHIIEKHWSRMYHPLEQLQCTLSENDDIDNDSGGVLVCDGCIQPITVSHRPYYACMRCSFFLHSFCATRLPHNLLPGASPFHPQHTLWLRRTDRILEIVRCKVCGYRTNGFYYYCKTCNIVIDIRCVFLPTRIKQKSHKHSLVQRPSSNSVCSVTNTRITPGTEYACETCSSFKVTILCAFYPSRMKHKYDNHPLTLRQPPFFHEGVFYCEICEEQVNNQVWLYHCGESCDHSFHYDCLRWHESVKLGRPFRLRYNDMTHEYTLTFKSSLRNNSSLVTSKYREQMNERDCFLGCNGCGNFIGPAIRPAGV